MATAKFTGMEEYEALLNRSAEAFEEVATAALRAGGAVAATSVSNKLQSVLSEKATGEIVRALGITPVLQSRSFDYNVHVGFDGYQTTNTQRVAFQLLGRVLESGTKKGREAKPFVKPALRESRTKIMEAMREAAEETLKKITEEM